jgi:hypothetical protein
MAKFKGIIFIVQFTDYKIGLSHMNHPCSQLNEQTVGYTVKSEEEMGHIGSQLNKNSKITQIYFGSV